MFPHPDYVPAEFAEPTVRINVAPDVGLEFGGPPVPVVLRYGAVDGASVPEAAIHEDGETFPGERDVDASLGAGDSRVKSVTQTSAPKFASKIELGLRVAGSLLCQTTPRGFVLGFEGGHVRDRTAVAMSGAAATEASGLW